MRGTVLGPDGPVAGAAVVATGAAEELLAGLPCGGEGAGDRKLLGRGCNEAGDQLVEVVAERRGEAAPLAYATSGPDGSFELAGLAAGELAVWAEEAGSGIGVRTGVHPGDTAADVTLAAGILLEGKTVTDGGVPVGGALVTAIHVERGRFFEASSGPDGRFRIGPIPAGEYPLLASAEGLLPELEWTRRGEVGAITIELPGPRAIVGRVLSGGAPAPGIAVRVGRWQRKLASQTDDAGAFRFEELRPGRYELVAGAELRAAFAEVEIEPGRDPEELVLELVDGGSVDGSVSDERGAPIAAAQLAISGGDGGSPSARSGEDGSFHLAPVAAGTHDLRVEAKGFVEHEEEGLQVIPGATSEVHVVLERAVRLAGQVVDPDGAPVGEAWIRARRTPLARTPDSRQGAYASTGSDADGTFELEGLQGAGFEVTVRHQDFVTYSGELRAPDGAVRIVLERGGEVTGTVVDGDGAPVAGASVELVPEERDSPSAGEARSGHADEGGAFRLQGVADGSYSLCASLDRRGGARRRSRPLPIEVRHGKAPQLVVKLVAGLGIAGRVLDAAGRPVPGAEVVASVPREAVAGKRPRRGSMPGDRAGEASSGEDGTFLVEELEAGSYELHATKRGHAVFAGKRIVRADAGATGVLLLLPAAAHVLGRVVRQDGAPVTSFEIDGETVRDPGGNFDVPVVGGAANELVVAARGFASATRVVTVPEGGSVTLDDIVLGAGRSLRGQLVDADSHQPVPGAKIWFQPGDDPEAPEGGLFGRDEGPRTFSDVGGRFQLTGVPDVPGRIWVDHAPQHAPRQSLVPPGDDLGVLLLDPGGTISGRVFVQDGGVAAEARVSAMGPVSRHTEAGPDGRFALRGLPPGAYALEGSANGGDEETARALVQLPSRGAVEVTLRPPSGGTTLTLLVRDASGATPDLSAGLVPGDVPVPTKLGDIIALSGVVQEAHELEGGELVVRHLAPGRFTLLVFVHQGGMRASIHRQLVDVGDSPLRLEVTLPAELPSLDLR